MGNGQPCRRQRCYRDISTVTVDISWYSRVVSVERKDAVAAVRALLRRAPVVAILGARQVGKTTLARDVVRAEGHGVTFFDLEDPDVVARLDDPMGALGPLRGLVVLDEVQRRPELFPVLRVLADRARRPARFLVLGSAAPALLRQSSESLAGRIAFHELGGFTTAEVGMRRAETLWLRGGFPRAFLARSDAQSDAWRRDLVATYLERDLRELGVTVPTTMLRRFWTMLAHWHGQIWNASELGRSLGVSDPTVRRYLDTLASTFMVRVLSPFHENLAKRQVKAPKVYFRDTGLLHTLLGIRNRQDLLHHPRLGASWEGFALQEVIRRLGARADECYFWRTHTGAEIDLVVTRGSLRRGFEVKRADSPRVTPSMRIAMDDLGLARIDVVHTGEESYPLAKNIHAVAFSRLDEDLVALH